jgi:hypothetical protein
VGRPAAEHLQQVVRPHLSGEQGPGHPQHVRPVRDHLVQVDLVARQRLRRVVPAGGHPGHLRPPEPLVREVAEAGEVVGVGGIVGATISGASSIADASRCRTTDVNSAVCFGSGVRCRIGAFDPGRPAPSSPAGSPPCPASTGPDGTRRSHPPAPGPSPCSRPSSASATGEAAPAPRPATLPAPRAAPPGPPAATRPPAARRRRIQPLLRHLAHGRELLGQHAHARQQHPVAPQPAHRPVEQRRRPLSTVHARPCRNARIFRPTPRPRTGGSLRRPGSPTRARTPSSPARCTASHRWVLNPQLRGQVLDDRPRHVQRIVHQEPADVADGASLHREPQMVGRRPRRSAIRSRSMSSRKKNRSSSSHVGSSTNRPYAAACSSVRNSTGTRRTVAAPRQRPTIFPGNPTRRPARGLDDQDQSQRPTTVPLIPGAEPRMRRQRACVVSWPSGSYLAASHVTPEHLAENPGDELVHAIQRWTAGRASSHHAVPPEEPHAEHGGPGL